MWSQIFLILGSVLGAIYISRRIIYQNHIRFVYISLLIAVIIRMAAEFDIPENIAETLGNGAISFATLAALVVLLLIIHYTKPQHVRSSVWYSYIPLIIFPALVFLVDSEGLLAILFMILQATALFVALFIIYLYAGNMNRKPALIGGFIFLLAGYGVYWYSGLEEQLLIIITNLCSGAGILLVSYSLPELLKNNVRK